MLFAQLLLMAGGYDGVVAWRPALGRWLSGALVAAYVTWAAYYVAVVGPVLRG